MLNAAIRQENATIESRRKEILRENENMQEKLYNLQNQLLEDLINTNGDILQDKVNEHAKFNNFFCKLFRFICRNYCYL